MAEPPISERHKHHWHQKSPIKEPVRAATTANITIATALNNGDSLDGVTLATDDRVLVKDQSTGSQNGIYVVGASPARAYDVSTDDPDVRGAEIRVLEGTVNGGTTWVNTNTTLPTIGTTALTFAAMAGGSGAPTTADYLVGTAQAGLSAEIVVGATPGGELGGTWGSPTVDATHSGSTHDAATNTHIADATDAHDASAISFSPTGTIAATDVQAAIAEVAAESGSGVTLSDDTPLVESGSGDEGTSGEASRSDHVHPADGGGGGGSLTMPSIIQWAKAGNAITSITIAAAASGHSLIMITNATTGQVTAVACTNTTWTQVATFTSAASSFYAVWVGVVAGGSSGTSITMTKPGSFNSVAVLEVTDTLTPTLGQSVAAQVNAPGIATANFNRITGHTAGRLIVFASGADNTTLLATVSPSLPMVGVPRSNADVIGAAYATAEPITVSSDGQAGGIFICELS